MSSSSEMTRVAYARQPDPRQLLAPGHAEQVRDRDQHPGLGEHRVHLSLQAPAQHDQLGAVAHQLAQLPGGRRGDPRLGQPAHPQQVRQITGVAHVVLHPPVPESLDAQRVRQVHVRARGLQNIDSPVVG